MGFSLNLRFIIKINVSFNLIFIITIFIIAIIVNVNEINQLFVQLGYFDLFILSKEMKKQLIIYLYTIVYFIMETYFFKYLYFDQN